MFLFLLSAELFEPRNDTHYRPHLEASIPKLIDDRLPRISPKCNPVFIPIWCLAGYVKGTGIKVGNFSIAGQFLSNGVGEI